MEYQCMDCGHIWNEWEWDTRYPEFKDGRFCPHCHGTNISEYDFEEEED